MTSDLVYFTSTFLIRKKKQEQKNKEMGQTTSQTSVTSSAYSQEVKNISKTDQVQEEQEEQISKRVYLVPAATVVSLVDPLPTVCPTTKFVFTKWKGIPDTLDAKVDNVIMMLRALYAINSSWAAAFSLRLEDNDNDGIDTISLVTPASNPNIIEKIYDVFDKYLDSFSFEEVHESGSKYILSKLETIVENEPISSRTRQQTQTKEEQDAPIASRTRSGTTTTAL